MKIWNTLKTTYKVSDFISWKRDKSLNLNPDFQRRSVWKPGAKSYLIDTIIRGLPIPMIFLRDQASSLKTFSPVRDVVDGQQRLRTVIAYIAPELLEDFEPSRDVFKIKKEHSPELQGRAFAQLPPSIQRQILDYQFSVNVFPSDTDDREVKQVFSRMNSSGYALNHQELRNAEWFGAFKTVAETLATEQLNRWRGWKIFNADDLARMKEVELTSELMILMMNGVSEKSEKVIDKYYEEYDAEFKYSDRIEKRFRRVFDEIETSFGNDVTRVFKKRTLFYGLFAAIYNLKYRGVPISKASPSFLTRKPVIKSIAMRGLHILEKTAPKSVVDATTRRTTHVKERKILVNYLLNR